ncbi:MAG: hypothetical protein P1U88_16820, partial [Thalassobaculaceae bacterium]|nr:hypothetical protein [Thalassobaculaceae bacterium]
MSGLIRLLSVLAVLAMAPGPVVASDFWTRALTDPASRLWTPLPPGSRIAVRPLDPDETGLPDSLLREVEQALTAALLATAPAGGGVASRRDLPVAWEEAESFGGADGQRLLADAAVEAVAVPALVERRGGVALSAVLIGVRDGAVGAVLATMPPTELAVDVTRFELTGAETGARRLGVALAEGLRAGRDPASAFAVRVARRGPRSPVADWFAGLVAQHLIRRLAEPPLYVTRSVRRMGEAPASGNAILALEVWDQGERADFQATAVMNGVEAQATVRIAIASIPAGFRPLTRDGGRVGDGFFQAVGRFTPSMRMDRREVLFAARVLARAALVADGLALGSSQGSGRDSGQGSGAREIAAAMTRLARGIPHEEIWRDRPAAGRGAVQALRARVAPVGGGTAPILEAAVERALYRQGDALSARV